MISLNRWHYSFAFLTLSIIIIPINFYPHKLFKLETSVWCFENKNQTNICKFKNICYNPQHKVFLFFLSKNSIIKGFSHYRQLQKVQLSSVQGHNQFYANLSVIDVKNFKLSKKLKIHSNAFLLSRFKPNNLMHCVHDDLFPLYLTLESICLSDLQCMENYDLVFHDNHSKGPFFYLYELFSKSSPIVLNELKLNSEFLLCFKEMVTGLVQDSVVYQYGFEKSHGPVQPTQLTQNDISRFALHVKTKLKIFNNVNNITEIILLSRQKNRKILNTSKLKEIIEHVYKKQNIKINVRQIDLNLFSNNLTNLIEIISNTEGLIGMHGAEMILSLFLKPNSFVVELFPFGINPDIVSFIKPISQLKDCNFVYYSWKNVLKNNSISHPDAPTLFGGISHLDVKTQMIIKNTQDVPPVQCCNNPLFLYHMYQDTVISADFEIFFNELLSKSVKQLTDSDGGEIINKWFHPYIVSNISCIFHKNKNLLHINWDLPFNVKNNTNLIYSLFIKDKKGLFSKDIATEKTNLQVQIPSVIETKFEIWISAYFNNKSFQSPDLYINC